MHRPALFPFLVGFLFLALADDLKCQSASDTIHDPLAGTLILVKGGTFSMGCLEGRDSDCYLDEKPPHKVTVHDFYIGQTEVTQAQWRAVMGSDPSFKNGCDQCPVERVRWTEVQDFLAKLNKRSGGSQYRLPTEAEWEYAARGGSQSRGYAYAGSDCIDEVAWYAGNASVETHTVNGKKANELGLYDMSGNVWEWCSDTYRGYPSGRTLAAPDSGPYRVSRGGAWSNQPIGCRLSTRNYAVPDRRYNSIGFRLARNP